MNFLCLAKTSIIFIIIVLLTLSKPVFLKKVFKKKENQNDDDDFFLSSLTEYDHYDYQVKENGEVFFNEELMKYGGAIKNFEGEKRKIVHKVKSQKLR